MRLRSSHAKLLLPLVATLTFTLLGPVGSAEAVAPVIVPSQHDHAAHDHGVTSVTDALAEATCGALEAIPAGDDLLCTHGPDTAPAGAAGGDRAGQPVPSQPLTCVEGGSTGQRVEVLYVYGPGGAAASSSRRADVRRWVEQVEWTVTESAQRFGGDRRVRWLMPSCALRITSVRVSSTALRDVRTFIDELSDAGYRSSQRSYLAFVDSTTYCGIATAPQDDDAERNDAERVAGYARVDRPCWGTGDQGFHSIAAHELFHTLGAVQRSAPNATRGSHCSDEHDVMCYDDGSGSAMRSVCRDGSSSTAGAGDGNDRLLDCRGDDYFHPSPRAGSYLASHWNTADHARLHDPAARARSSSGSSPTLLGNPVGYAFQLVFG